MYLDSLFITEYGQTILVLFWGGEKQHHKLWDKPENVLHGNQSYCQQCVPVVAFPHIRVHYSWQDLQVLLEHVSFTA